jgi:NADPH:quinone reductase-like Zn-dependent oxidoreductase
MKGVIVEQPQSPFKVADNLEKPEPGPDQILVKSLYTAINPV